MRDQFTPIITAISLLSGSAVAGPLDPGPLDPVPLDTAPPLIESDDDWVFELRPYLWTVNLEGLVGLNGIVTPVDLSFRDILDNLDMALAGTLDIRKGKWGLIIDANYLRMSTGIGDVPFQLFNTVGISVEQMFLSAGLFYRVAEWDRGFLDVGAGAMYMYLKNEIDLSLSQSGVTAVSDRLAAEAVDRVAVKVQKEVNRRLASLRAQIAGLVPPGGPPLPTGKALDRVVSGISDRIDARDTERAIRKTLEGTTANLANSDLGGVGNSGPIRDRIRELVKAQAQERIAAQVAGLKSRAAKKAAQLRKQAERKLSSALQKEINRRIPDQVEISEGWVDPFVAARVRHFVTDRIYLNLFGMYGGFGVGSDETWQVGVGPGWVVNDWLTLELYYRHMEVDYENDGFLFDAEMTGLFLGAVIAF